MKDWRLFVSTILCFGFLWLPGNNLHAANLLKGFTLTEIGQNLYDADLVSGNKTSSQLIVDRLAELGVLHIILSPRATMNNPRNSYLTPMTPAWAKADEKSRYLRLIEYIHGKGMTVGIRPIFFVVDGNGQTPYVEILPNGTEKIWWHGNIEPESPTLWFGSFREYLTPYLEIAREAKIAEFTLGAELESLTVGVSSVNPYGYPAEWIKTLEFARGQLDAATRIEYDLNYTDEGIDVGGGKLEYGGELARWRHRIADSNSFPSQEAYESWKNLVKFWKLLDGVGIDVYRSLAASDTVLPEDFEQLVQLLTLSTKASADYVHWALSTIWPWTGKDQRLSIKEVGFRSVDKCFVDPYVYAGGGALNIAHQAAAYEAIFRAFWTPGYTWFGGVAFWDASVDYTKHGPFDLGFSPIGKQMTEEVIGKYFWQ